MRERSGIVLARSVVMQSEQANVAFVISSCEESISRAEISTKRSPQVGGLGGPVRKYGARTNVGDPRHQNNRSVERKGEYASHSRRQGAVSNYFFRRPARRDGGKVNWQEEVGAKSRSSRFQIGLPERTLQGIREERTYLPIRAELNAIQRCRQV